MVMVACSIITMALVLSRWLEEPGSTIHSLPDATQVPNWAQSLTGGHSEGPEEAAVSIVVFSELQCPACRAFASRVRLMRLDYADTMAFLRVLGIALLLGSAHPATAQVTAPRAEGLGFLGLTWEILDPMEMDPARQRPPIVSGIFPCSPAHLAGFEPGDILLRVNEKDSREGPAFPPGGPDTAYRVEGNPP